MGDGQVDEDRPSPHLVPSIHHATRIAAGGSGACAVLQDGRVSCWGEVMGYFREEDAPLPRPALGLPRHAPGLKHVVDIGVGKHAIGCAVSDQGAAWCFRGGATIAAPMRTRRVALSGPLKSSCPSSEQDATITQIGCSNGSCCALTRSGSVWCQGLLGSLVPGVAPDTDPEAFVPVPDLCLHPTQ
jgi:hypothetical protein